jgi:hypothetical protein
MAVGLLAIQNPKGGGISSLFGHWSAAVGQVGPRVADELCLVGARERLPAETPEISGVVRKRLINTFTDQRGRAHESASPLFAVICDPDMDFLLRILHTVLGCWGILPRVDHEAVRGCWSEDDRAVREREVSGGFDRTGLATVSMHVAATRCRYGVLAGPRMRMALLPRAPDCGSLWEGRPHMCNGWLVSRVPEGRGVTA